MMKISVIIPVFNEEKIIRQTLENLLSRHSPDEVLVVDGGSADRTVPIAKEFAKVLSSHKGRARQMNEGARSAAGDILLFLHADTILPEDGLSLVRRVMENGRAEAGRFRMRFDSRHFLLRLFESYTHFHCFSYGDQGFFITRHLFEKLNGFREDVPFEDLDFYRRLRQITRPLIIQNPVTTSARRFSETGFMKQKFINLFLVGLYYAGFDIVRLQKKFYPDVR